MPRFADIDLETNQNPVGRTGLAFSHVPLANLGASEYTLVTIAVDVSGSTENFIQQMESVLGATIEMLNNSPRADNLLIRVITFNDTLHEMHGFIELTSLGADHYKNTLRASGMTALYDGMYNAADAIDQMARQMKAEDYSCNGLVLVITDGLENRSKHGGASVFDRITQIKQSEYLESLSTILVGLNAQLLKRELDLAAQATGFDYIDAGNADATGLAKLTNFFAQSISSASQALGTGGPSQALDPSNLTI